MPKAIFFRDRQDAGQRLAKELARFRDQRPAVLALPRGGVPVGLEVARALEAPLDVILVRKLGHHVAGARDRRHSRRRWCIEEYRGSLSVLHDTASAIPMIREKRVPAFYGHWSDYDEYFHCELRLCWRGPTLSRTWP